MGGLEQAQQQGRHRHHHTTVESSGRTIATNIPQQAPPTHQPRGPQDDAFEKDHDTSAPPSSAPGVPGLGVSLEVSTSIVI
ncbi:hypothetical protein CFC21_100586 [Triticum aestivum]|uniref:Uncharacterized protein n=2 Tax=Triticum aestivum TaxID=4565 RepID=A0A9R1M1B3_WHEAT|nr:hypothetical protein CFC21_100586 [Triticum aestivum]